MSVEFISCREESTNKEKQHVEAQIEIGHLLFFDNQISINHTKSCGSCHSPEFAFTDGYRKSITALGENVMHNAPTLINSVDLHFFDWANPHATSLGKQIKRPLYNVHPMELGLDQHLDEFQAYLKSHHLYAPLFKSAFPNATKMFSIEQIETCLIQYEKQLVSKQSDFDLHRMNTSAHRGFRLFTSDRLNCAKCHTPPSFTLATLSDNTDSVYVNIGLYNVNGTNQYPASDAGLINHNQKADDNGKFKIPSLRNVMLTAPYMHDGSVASIEEVIDLYTRGGRTITYGEYQGDGANNKFKHPLIKGFSLSLNEKQDLINFLHALSDTSIKSNKLFSNPFSN